MGYEAVFQHRELLRSYLNSVVYTVLGSALSVIVTMMAAYVLTRKFAGKKGVTLYILVTMFFSGGLIPSFLMNRTLGLYNTVLIMILLNSVSVWNLMVARTYISSTVPNELYEAASIDGANHFVYFFRVVLPLSGTIIAVLAVYYGVARWNDYFTALVYIRDRVKLPLQTILREVIATLTTSLSDANFFAALDSDQRAISEAIRKAQVAKYCCIVVSTAPTVALYMLMQKYFVKGVLIGSLKG
jgi:putative aldouronate transport system permease protein